jgi:hypothetical protein
MAGRMLFTVRDLWAARNASTIFGITPAQVPDALSDIFYSSGTAGQPQLSLSTPSVLRGPAFAIARAASGKTLGRDHPT